MSSCSRRTCATDCCSGDWLTLATCSGEEALDGGCCVWQNARPGALEVYAVKGREVTSSVPTTPRRLDFAAYILLAVTTGDLMAKRKSLEHFWKVCPSSRSFCPTILQQGFLKTKLLFKICAQSLFRPLLERLSILDSDKLAQFARRFCPKVSSKIVRLL